MKILSFYINASLFLTPPSNKRPPKILENWAFIRGFTVYGSIGTHFSVFLNKGFS